jgi:hypothetical protein
MKRLTSKKIYKMKPDGLSPAKGEKVIADIKRVWRSTRGRMKVILGGEVRLAVDGDTFHYVNSGEDTEFLTIRYRKWWFRKPVIILAFRSNVQ